MKCTECKSDVTLRRVVELYDPNLPGVVVDGIERGTCPNCGEAFRAVTRLRELHRLAISSVLNKPRRLAPSEVRWLRLSMNLKAEELGHKFNVTATHISRWETGAAAISALADRLLRMVAASFHSIDPPKLEDIDGERSDPLMLRITLRDKGWSADGSKQPKVTSPAQAAVRQSAYKSTSRAAAGTEETARKAKIPVRGLRKSAQEAKRGKIA